MTSSPHRNIQTHSERERFLVDLLDNLWERYRRRMVYVRQFEAILQSYGTSFLNDHIAFRTIALQKPVGGIFHVSRIFEALDYAPVSCYEFPDKHLSSIHYQHPNPQFPKLFVTQLKSWELTPKNQRVVNQVLRRHRPPLSAAVLSALKTFSNNSSFERRRLLSILSHYFEDLPWDAPQKEQVLQLDHESQYGAWVLLNGYDVNHFTARVNKEGVSALNDIEKVVAEMIKAKIPMKKEIEGERGSKLRQTSTESVILETSVKEGSRKIRIPWTYAYFEIAERPLLKNPVTGQIERFEGFLGPQATRLFDMTTLPN